MSAITINRLDDVNSSFSANDYLIVGQGDLGKKTKIQGLFDLTKDSSDKGVRINYISYTLDQSDTLTLEEKAQARSNLGIAEDGKTVSSGVDSLNGKTGVLTMYLDNITVNSSNAKTGTTYINDSITNAISTHNNDRSAHYEEIQTTVKSLTPSIADTRIDIHNGLNNAHEAAFNEFKSKLDNEYASKNYVTDKLSNYALRSDIPKSLSDLTDGKNTISKIISPSGDVLNPSSTDRSVTLDAAFIGAVPVSRKVNGQPLSDNVEITASGINALSTESGGTVKEATTFNKGVSIKGDLNLISSSSTTKFYLNSSMYGYNTPSTGTNGQIFFVLSS